MWADPSGQGTGMNEKRGQCRMPTGLGSVLGSAGTENRWLGRASIA